MVTINQVLASTGGGSINQPPDERDLEQKLPLMQAA